MDIEEGRGREEMKGMNEVYNNSKVQLPQNLSIYMVMLASVLVNNNNNNHNHLRISESNQNKRAFLVHSTLSVQVSSVSHIHSGTL